MVQNLYPKNNSDKSSNSSKEIVTKPWNLQFFLHLYEIWLANFSLYHYWKTRLAFPRSWILPQPPVFFSVKYSPYSNISFVYLFFMFFTALSKNYISNTTFNNSQHLLSNISPPIYSSYFFGFIDLLQLDFTYSIHVLFFFFFWLRQPLLTEEHPLPIFALLAGCMRVDLLTLT